MDREWWKFHINEVNQKFYGERYSKNKVDPRWNVQRLEYLETFGNSGAATISMAAQGDAARIILLGFDCQWTNGKAHWHGNHPAGLGNAGMTAQWLERFELLARTYNQIEIVNATRETALTCFPRVSLEILL